MMGDGRLGTDRRERLAQQDDRSHSGTEWWGIIRCEPFSARAHMGFSSGETQLTDALLSAVFLIVVLTAGQYFSKNRAV